MNKKVRSISRPVSCKRDQVHMCKCMWLRCGRSSFWRVLRRCAASRVVRAASARQVQAPERAREGRRHHAVAGSSKRLARKTRLVACLTRALRAYLLVDECGLK
eukprot:5511772-Pleurochrysis_carterae.AAC.3